MTPRDRKRPGPPGLQLHLLVPGLLGPLPGRLWAELDWPRPASLERLLARADQCSLTVTSAADLLFYLSGLPSPSGVDLPSAALCRLADGFPPDDGCWMHADPVHLKPDRDRVLLFDARHLELSREQAEQLARQVEVFYRDDGWRLEMASPERWYLRLPRTPAMRTRPIEEAVGRSLEPYLPAGPEAVPWRTRLNEVQMLLHHSEVNQQREQSGRPAINGLWLWGAGRLPAVPRHIPLAEIYADQLLARGLALHLGIAVHPRPVDLDQLLDGQVKGEVLVLLDDLHAPLLDADPMAWRDAVEALERAWFLPLTRALGRRSLGLYLYAGQARRYACTSRSLRRFWRRRQPLASHITAGAKLP